MTASPCLEIPANQSFPGPTEFLPPTTIATATNGFQVVFGAPSNIPDSGVGPATSYTLQSSPSLGTNTVWQPVGTAVVGDDHLHTITVPADGPMKFFRLQAD